MMKLKITTFVLIGGLIGALTEGIMIGVIAASLVFIAYQLERMVEKNERN
ncbi:hypothetical protein [Robertmurraya andreesenii]|uniref:Uncharacterized protein n=1 Tax=Anoxybacillus andreesenii TaxID=1325932 RepID=A0ABT9VAD8_9BACL|nr:hypothetical protein [Robertmurraya andreesenii]MDQ0157933.1 hypothetical protein [Robertmurraya andreesenii]